MQWTNSIVYSERIFVNVYVIWVNGTDMNVCIFGIYNNSFKYIITRKNYEHIRYTESIVRLPMLILELIVYLCWAMFPELIEMIHLDSRNVSLDSEMSSIGTRVEVLSLISIYNDIKSRKTCVNMCSIISRQFKEQMFQVDSIYLVIVIH